jgi:hypothetical protein
VSGIPAAWRVTLSWPMPAGYGTASKWIQRVMEGKEDPLAGRFGYLYQGTVSGVEVTARPRGLAVAMTVPAGEPSPRSAPGGYRTSAERAVQVALECARFGYCTTFGGGLDTLLPEPVRVTVKPAARTGKP